MNDYELYKEIKYYMGKFNLHTNKDNTITVTLDDGTKVNGSLHDVLNILNRLGYNTANLVDSRKYYLSESKGLVLISDMATQHIRNAILKHYSEWLNNIRGLTGKAFYNEVLGGPTTLAGLVSELSRRND